MCLTYRLYHSKRGGGRDPYLTLSVYTSLIGGAAAGRGLHNWRLGHKLKEYFGAAHDNLFINKKPNEHSLPTKPSHALASHTVRNNQMSSAIGYPIWGGIGIGLGNFFDTDAKTTPGTNMTDSQETLAALGFLTLLTAGITYYTKYYSTAWRFNKVVKGDWVITDEPPKKTKLVPVKDIVKTYLPKPAPQPAHRLPL